MLVSLVSWIAAMLTLSLWRKVSSSVIFPLIQFALHCISRRQLVGVGVKTGPGFISISPAHWSRSLSSSAGIDRSATKGDLTSRERSEALAIDSVSRWYGREEATSIQTGISSQMVRWMQGWLSNWLTRVTFDALHRTVNLKQSLKAGFDLTLLLFIFHIDVLTRAVEAP